MRIGFERADGHCVFSSERDKFARMTYEANFGEKPCGDIREINVKDIPNHDVLLAGFPCQPFSIAGVSSRASLNIPDGFQCQSQGTLFFEIIRILKAKRPKAFLLENVKNLKTHDGGRTFRVIVETLESLDYSVQSEVIDAAGFVPQHRHRIFIVGFDQRRPEFGHRKFDFSVIKREKKNCVLGNILEPVTSAKYILSDRLWRCLQKHAKKHREKGNGFGYGLADLAGISRTLTARYHKDGSEILIPRKNGNPRRLTPRECARLMGFDDDFIIPVSDTQAYRQFGNSVVVPLVQAIASEMARNL
jgi:DNA (cytosine-5)-methyltransferase 1